MYARSRFVFRSRMAGFRLLSIHQEKKNIVIKGGMTCCGCTFVFFAVLAMGCSLSALWLPLVVVVPEDGMPYFPTGGSGDSNSGSSNSGDSKHSMLALLGKRAHVSASAPKKHRAFKQQELTGLPDGTFQCPFFNNDCYFGSIKLAADGINIRTDDVVFAAGCDALGELGDGMKSRFWDLAAAGLSIATVLIAIGHACKGNNFGQHAALIKFGAAGVAAAHVGTCGVVFILQGPIARCLQDSITDVYDLLPGQYIIVMISLLMSCAAATLNFFNAIGMLCSWCMSCCGSPSGRESQGQTIQYIYVTNEAPLVATYQQPYDAYGRQGNGNLQQTAPAPGYPVKY